MSSLLDILQKKASQPAATDTFAVMPASPESHTQTQELRLAVDNRSAHTQTVEPELSLDLQEEPAAFSPEPIPAAQPDADPVAEIIAEPVSAAADATPPLLISQRRQRIKRNTSLLIGSLVLILLIVTTAISILLQYTANRDSEQSVTITPEELESASTQAVANEPAQAPVVRPLRTEVTSPQAAPVQSVAAGRDTDWFDTPAVETQDTATQITITRGTTANPLFPKLSEAWNAFQAADYARAETLYREVQTVEANNVDALLGLAAIALRGGREQEAQSLYKAVLEADPKNSAAVAALSTLPAGASSDGATGNETRLKNLLREQPGAANLQFALGLQYLSTGRWPEAQQAFFEAVRHEPTNADYAFNLAVSLDQLGQASAAAAYYERALTLANDSALFDAAAARQRLDSLRAAAL